MSKFTVLLTPDVESGGYTVTVPALPGCVTDGETIESALDRVEEAISLYLQDEDEGTRAAASRAEVIVASVEVGVAKAEAFQSTNQRLDFKHFLLSAPDMDTLDLERDQSPPREVNLTRLDQSHVSSGVCMSIQDGNRPEPPFSAPPQEMVEAFLDYLRATMLWKVEGLSDEDLRRPFPPSTMTLLGMIKHIAYVERWWFRIVLAGEELPVPWTDDDPDADWRVEPDESTAAIIDLYKGEIECSRAIVAAASWDDPAKRPGNAQTLGWILTHMVEETARHCGHADLFREQIDGATGE